MQVTSILSRHEHAPDPMHEHDSSCDVCGHDHEHIPVHLGQTLVGLIFVVNAFIVDWLFEQGTVISNFSAMIGAIILGYPIMLTAWKDLRRGLLSINELVAIAVLAAFASGKYVNACLVSFINMRG